MPLGIDGHAFPAASGEGLQIRERAVGFYLRHVGYVFRLAADVDALARLCSEKAIRVEVVAETPAGYVRRGALLEDAARGEKNAAVRRDVFAALRSGRVGGEHLRERGELHRVEVELIFELAVVPLIARAAGRMRPDGGWRPVAWRTVNSSADCRGGTSRPCLRGPPRKAPEVARFVEGKIDGIERSVALDGEALFFGPRIDPLVVMIDEVELACRVDRRAGDGEEAVFKLLYLRARSQDGGCVGSERCGGSAGMSSTANSRSRTSR